MFKKGSHIIVLLVIAALCFWLIDAVMDYFFYYDEPFLSLLIFNKSEVAGRLFFSIVFLLFGLIMNRMFSIQKRTEKALIQEISERAQIEKKLYELSTQDNLTGLYNRRGFLTLVEQQLKMEHRERREKIGMYFLFADMDNLKEINDTYGHQEGDRALVEMAKILKDTFRESDIIARIGGDKFVAVPVGTTGETVNIIADRINRNIELNNAEKARPYRISFNFGLVYYSSDSPVSIDELLSQGDKLMYEQKNRKKFLAETGQQSNYEM